MVEEKSTLGLIEKSTYQKMLRRLEDLPILVEAFGLRDQSKASSSKEMEKDLKEQKAENPLSKPTRYQMSRSHGKFPRS